ncbi:HCP-like protein [Serendipita vermifera]|nr:HCP-like protein [Serendipita vermifera]
MSVPQLPPRPNQQSNASGYNNQQLPSTVGPPPVPPLPPGFRPEIDGLYDSQPHYGDPMVAPRPQKLMSSVPADMARTLESQMPATPAPGPMGYGQQVPSISFSTPPIPGGYPQTPQPPQNAPYQAQQYNQAYNPNQYRGTTPLPYPGTPQPYQVQQQRPISMTGLPPGGFVPPRMGPSPAPMQSTGPNLTPGFTPRPQSWGGNMTPTPQPGNLAPRPMSGVFRNPSPGPGGFGQPGLQPQQAPQQANMQALQQGLQSLSLVGIQTPAPNPNWVNGSTPPVSRPTSGMGGHPPSTRYHIDNSVAGLTFSDPVPQKAATPPSLIVQLPTVATLASSLNAIQASKDPGSKVAWCKDVMSALDRAIQASGSTPGEASAKELLLPPPGASPPSENDVTLLRLSDIAVSTLMGLLAPPLPIGPNNSMPPYIAEALFLRGQIIAAGSFPEKLAKSPRDAFRDFEASARGGYAPAWFKLGRDYETVGDLVRAKECIERGVQRGVGSCFYRLGMAYLQGQLNLPQDPAIAMPLLQRAAFLSSIEVPQPAYVYALLLLQEFPHITLPQQLLQSLVPAAHPTQTNPGAPPPTLMSESRKYLERSAYLGFTPALYKLGQSYEHAIAPFPYDPLMSVQYYSLASQQGDPLADLALSKWFLVGSGVTTDSMAPQAEGFEKDEGLALIFAEKAASKGEAGGEFAVGYYCEVGIGRPADLKEARRWYERAAKQGHEDAKARLKELAKEAPKLLGVQEHQGRLERMRTNAKERMKANQAAQAKPGEGGVPPLPSTSGSAGMLSPMTGASVVAMARTSSMMHHSGSQHHRIKMQDFERVGATAPAKAEEPSASLAPPAIAPKPSSSASGTPSTAAAAAPTPQSKPAASSSGGKNKPATFAEMGYHSSKLEEKECIIM